jgi:hypothetical protein
MTTTNDRQPPVAILVILLAAIVFFFCLHGCKPIPTIARADTTERTIIKEVLRDTVIYRSDSAGFAALLECDSLGKVHVKQVQDFYAGQFIKPTIVVKNNIVKVACIVDSLGVYVSWKNRYESKEVRTNQVVIVKENYLTGWQWFQVWGFRIMAGLVILIFGGFCLKKYIKV